MTMTLGLRIIGFFFVWFRKLPWMDANNTMIYSRQLSVPLACVKGRGAGQVGKQGKALYLL